MPSSLSSLTAARQEAEARRIVKELGTGSNSSQLEQSQRSSQVLTFKPGAAIALATA